MYKLYPAGRGVPSTHDDLNAARVLVETKLKDLTHPYHWFTVLKKSESVEFGVKVENGRNTKEQMETELRSAYPELYIGFGSEYPDNCEIMAIATQCRTQLEERIPIAKWKGGQIGFIIHCMLNPYGYDNEAWTYWTSLCCIDEEREIADADIKDVITLVRSFLEYKKGMELEDDYEKLEVMLEELEGFTEFLRRKLA